MRRLIRWIIAKLDAAADRNIDPVWEEHDREEKERRELGG